MNMESYMSDVAIKPSIIMETSRKFITVVMGLKPGTITILSEITEKGDIGFSIRSKKFPDVFKDYAEAADPFFLHTVNFLGEMLVRENVDLFAGYLMNIDMAKYKEATMHNDHRLFGFAYGKGTFTFLFHISFLSRILTEDFRKQIVDG